MEHNQVAEFHGMLVVNLGVAKLAGDLAKRVGQRAVLGELIGGVLVGPSVLGWLNPHDQTPPLLSE
jgi:Kef-type K+ transport system membrane component KefB